MRLTSLRVGDLVQCDIKGRRFHAEVLERAGSDIEIRPLQNGVSYRHVRPRQVIAHWRKVGQRTTAATAAVEPVS